jgi:hypothetical protein
LRGGYASGVGRNCCVQPKYACAIAQMTDKPAMFATYFADNDDILPVLLSQGDI